MEVISQLFYNALVICVNGKRSSSVAKALDSRPIVWTEEEVYVLSRCCMK